MFTEFPPEMSSITNSVLNIQYMNMAQPLTADASDKHKQKISRFI